MTTRTQQQKLDKREDIQILENQKHEQKGNTVLM